MSAGHIRERGPNTWRLKYDAGRDPLTGKRITRYATIKGAKRDAQRELRKLLAAVDEGRAVDPSKLTVLEHLRARLAQWQASGKIGHRTAENRAGMIERHIAPYIGALELQKLKFGHIESWHNSLRERGLCARSIRDVHIVLKAALDEAVKHGLAGRNEAALVKAPSAATKREDDDEAEIEDAYLTAEQVAETLKGLEGHPLYAPVAVALYTGVRRSELLALQWRHVDLDARALKVRFALEETKAGGIRVKAPKTKAGLRTIRLPEAVVTALRDHRREQLEARMALGLGRLPDDAPVFPLDYTGGYISPRAFSALASRGADARLAGGRSPRAAPRACLNADRCRRRYCHHRLAPRPCIASGHAARVCSSLPEGRQQGRGCNRRGVGCQFGAKLARELNLSG